MTNTLANTLIDDANYIKEVRNQYENFPYPLRNPADEKNSFGYTAPCALDYINYYHYSGKRDFSKGFRALIAGGGTGDATVILAEQFRDMDAEIIHLDISAASMQVAKDRIKVRGLDNVTWIHGSLLDAPRILEGKFDYINCSGVLHHLESPEAGLAALAAVLKDDGVMALMLYAKYGREGVYQIQNLMKILNKHEDNIQRKVENSKAALADLPKTSGFENIRHLFTDIQMGDMGIYDLLLHSHDMAYSVPDLYAFLKTSNLNLTHFFYDAQTLGNDLYRLEAYVKDPALQQAIKTPSTEEKQAAAELMHGKIIKHVFFASKIKPPLPSIDDLDNVPHLSMMMSKSACREICNYLKTVEVGGELGFTVYHHHIKFIKTPNLDRIFQYLDGTKSIAEIFKDVRGSFSAIQKKPSIEELKKEFAAIFSAFNMHDVMYLKHKSVPPLKTCDEIQEIQRRMK